ncbi:cytochrome P450 [Amycolatopsis acidicola]|uniref:Cytochrome P450 n=1 Tax=Amycolatopsis acidicola TaxID=2596893 RepID=A0A5N0VJY7_9PSEU|nr:cytochrome P450 [Amycolatopsis acidicola]KAA9166515.1 cytochrome P450 [Amycolatopsis acidicola]
MPTAPPAANAYGPGFQLDPFPTLARLRAEAPVNRMTHPEVGECWVVIRYPEVKALSADPRLRKPQNPKDGNSLNSPPPVHTRLRKLVQAAFTTQRMEALRGWTEHITERLLDGMARQGEVDLLEAFTDPMPVAVISRLLGVPDEELAEVHRCARGFLTETEALRDEMFGVAHQYVVSLVARKRENPGDDVTSALIAARDGHDRLDEDELVRMVMALLVNGSITTTTVLGTGTNLLLTHPDQHELLRRRPALVPGAVEEILRMEAPIGAITWEAAEDIPVGDEVIAAGDYVMTSVQGANRDPGWFTDPDRFDITRSPNPHLTFSHGIHHCLGAPLARMEARVALGALLRRFPGMRLAGAPSWRDSYVVRGLTRLPVDVGTSAS